MNKDQFIGYLENPDRMQSNVGGELAELITDYPFFQSAHLLYLKHLSKEKSAKYAPQLKIAAAYASDRQKLYELVIREDLQTKINLIEKEKDPSGDDTKITPLEEEILKEAVNASIQIEVTKPKKKEGITKSEIIPEPQPKEPLEKSGSRSFTDWLNALQGEPTEHPATASSDKSLIDSFISENPKIGSLATDTSQNPDGFDENDRASFFNPVNTARLSIVDDESFVTETLAKIYEAQHLYDKAIKAYEILSLKFPEKRNTFAARIESLNKKQSQ